MNTQPEALRLADALTRAVQQEAPDDDTIVVARWFVEDSATELRRLHQANADLLEALQKFEAWSKAESNHEGTTFWERVEMLHELDACARVAIAKHSKEQA